jgi:RNA polymerase sigma factor (sigma-70 family)
LTYLLRFCLFYLGERSTNEDAEDAWESFYLKRLPSIVRLYQPVKGRRFWNYLLLCLQRECRHQSQKLTRRDEVEQPLEWTLTTEEGEIELMVLQSPGEDPAASLEEVEFRQALQRCLNKLPEHHRKAFTLVVLQDVIYEQASAELREQPATVRVWVCRARAALRKCLGSEGWNG